MEDGFNGGFFVAVSNGIGIDRLSVKMGEKQNTAVLKGCLLPTPQTQVGKGIFTPPGRDVKEDGIILLLLSKAQFGKWNHLESLLVLIL
jgi:hypothetical protein